MKYSWLRDFRATHPITNQGIYRSKYGSLGESEAPLKRKSQIWFVICLLFFFSGFLLKFPIEHLVLSSTGNICRFARWAFVDYSKVKIMNYLKHENEY